MKHALVFHRSLTFWTGLLILIFSCWAWRDSCTHVAGFQWGQVAAVSAAHGTLISWHVGGIFPFDVGKKPAPPGPLSPPHDPFPPPFLVRSQAPDPSSDAKKFSQLPHRPRQQLIINHSPPGSWSLYLPYWIIILALLISWSVAQLWRALRHWVSLPGHP